MSRRLNMQNLPHTAFSRWALVTGQGYGHQHVMLKRRRTGAAQDHYQIEHIRWAKNLEDGHAPEDLYDPPIRGGLRAVRAYLEAVRLMVYGML